MSDHVLVADVADDQLDLAGQVFGPLAVAVYLLDQAVERSNLMATAKKLAADCAADKSGAPGD
jgi:hypothetical protein